jgi:hypothetical protein
MCNNIMKCCRVADGNESKYQYGQIQNTCEVENNMENGVNSVR